MTTLFDARGHRKYLIEAERSVFIAAALARGGPIATFCVTLGITGARISEVLALTPDRVDFANGAVVLETLKRRKRGIFRAVPVPPAWLDRLRAEHAILSATDGPAARGQRIWSWGRTTAWHQVKDVMREAGIPDAVCMPKALRHGFGSAAIQNGVPLNVVQTWLGHARIETTAIYTTALGEEERALARRTWRGLDAILRG